MNKRNRASTAAEAERPVNPSPMLDHRPITSFAPRQPLTERQRKKLLMKNVLHNVELIGETTKTLPKRKGNNLW